MLKLATKLTFDNHAQRCWKTIFSGEAKFQKKTTFAKLLLCNHVCFQIKNIAISKKNDIISNRCPKSLFLSQKHSDFVTTLHRNPKGPVKPGNPSNYVEVKLCFIVIYSGSKNSLQRD